MITIQNNQSKNNNKIIKMQAKIFHAGTRKASRLKPTNASIGLSRF